MTTSHSDELEAKLGFRFRNPELLERALTHSSFANEATNGSGSAESATGELVPADASPQGDGSGDNERLEYLGDAVLQLIVSEALFDRFGQLAEGDLSKLRAHLVSQNHLARVAQQLELGRFLRLGRGELHSGGRHKAALLSDAIEALLGAIYLYGWLEPSRRLLSERIIWSAIEALERSCAP